MWNSKKLFELSSFEYIFSQTCPLGFWTSLKMKRKNPEVVKTVGRNVIKLTDKYLFNWYIDKSSSSRTAFRVDQYHLNLSTSVKPKKLSQAKNIFDDPGEMKAVCKK